MVKKKSAGSKKASAPKKKTSSKKGRSAQKTSVRKRSPVPKKGLGKKKSLPKHSKFSVVVMTLGILVVAGALAYVILHPDIPEITTQKSVQTVQTKTPKNHKPRFEIFPVDPLPARVPTKPAQSEIPVHRQPSMPEKLPKVAIIIDDIGYDKILAEKFMKLDAVLTYSILPFARFSNELAHRAVEKGYQVMLHLPMEPNEYPSVDPGKGVLLASMTPDERIDQLEKDLDALPRITGVNNHMGSKLTTLSDEMNQVFSTLKKRGLFFIDSRTTAATQSKSSAKLFKVPYAERDVFLDHIQTREEVQRQIDHLIQIAEITGTAVGIGHPHEVTYDVLVQNLPELKKRVKLVRASEIVKIY